MRIEMVKRLIDLCLEINGTEPRNIDDTGELPTVFFNFSGHTASFEIKIFTNGWQRDLVKPDSEFTVYLDDVLFNILEFEAAYDALLKLKERVCCDA